MKKKKGGYKTNKAGYIKAGNSQTANEPKAEAKRGNDLRAGKGSSGKR